MSVDWMAGYVSDVPYTLGYYRELAPSYLNYVCHVCGVEGLPSDRKLRYAELGCGRGFSTALLAAANPDIDFVGIDFNPSHIAEARAFAKRAMLTNLTFSEASFGDAAHSNDPALSQFDVVAMHGVYSWIDSNVRQELHHFIRNALVPGGVVYVSYNVMPGWASMIPVQRLLLEVASRGTGDSIAKLQHGMRLLQTLMQVENAFVIQNPALKPRIASMEKQDARYLAHEYLNKGWHPLFVTDVMQMLSAIKLSYVGSASLPENHLETAVPRDLRILLTQASDPAMRELLMDYAINKQFRRDVYVKGPQKLAANKQRSRLADATFGLIHSAKEPPEKLRVPIGEIVPKKQVVAAVLERLRLSPSTGSALTQVATKAGAAEANVTVLLELLVHAGAIAPARSNEEPVDHDPARRLNAVILEYALASDTHRFLASPILGSAIGANDLDRISAFLIGKDPKGDDRKIAIDIFDHMKESKRELIRGGKSIVKDAENLSEMTAHVRDFRNLRLPRWRALKIVD